MSYTKEYVIAPPSDIELNIETRTELQFYLSFPDSYNGDAACPLFFAIPGWGDSADSEYQSQKLRPYLADKYNAIVAGVRYHNDKRKGSDVNIDVGGLCRYYDLKPEIFRGKNFHEILNLLGSLLVDRHLFRLDPNVAITSKSADRYSSFGFLPALDHLQVLKYVQDNFSIDKNRIIAFGSSYGGYVSMLMSKFAPNTFCAVIENSAFCKINLNEIFSNYTGVSGSFVVNHKGKRHEITNRAENVWSLDETSPHYFSDGHRRIRSLLIPSHWLPSKTVHFMYHSVEDALEPVANADRCAEMIEKKRKVVYRKITKDDVDGRIFKNLTHGMDASLRNIFDISIAQLEEHELKNDGRTDFDLGSRYVFECCDRNYCFDYLAGGLNVGISTQDADLAASSNCGTEVVR